jgi:hypothetical protein
MNSPFLTLRFWIEVTLAGFLYLAAAFFFLQTWFGVHELDLVSKEVLPYAATAAIAASYVFGLILHSLIPMVFRALLPEETKQWLRNDIPTRTEKDRSNDSARLAQFGSQELLLQLRGIYSTLVLFRLFAPGIFVFGFSLASWCMDTASERYAPMILVISTALSFAFLQAYRKQFSEYTNYEGSAARALSGSRRTRRH